MQFDDNIQLAADGLGTECAHCGVALGEAHGEPLRLALCGQRPSMAAGPGIRAEPGLYSDREIVLRQAFCPGCLALLATEIAPADEAGLRGWKLG